MRQVENKKASSQKGDYWVCMNGEVIFRCPYCDTIVSAANHQIISIVPLTIRPSIDKPDAVECPCKHHYRIQFGWAE